MRKTRLLWGVPLIPLALLLPGYFNREPPDTRKKAITRIGSYPKLSIAAREAIKQLAKEIKRTPEARVYELSFVTGAPASISAVSPPLWNVTLKYDDDRKSIEYVIAEPMLSNSIRPGIYDQIHRDQIARMAANGTIETGRGWLYRRLSVIGIHDVHP